MEVCFRSQNNTKVLQIGDGYYQMWKVLFIGNAKWVVLVDTWF